MVFLLMPVFPHTLYCGDLPIPPPYRQVYLASTDDNWGETFPIVHIWFAGRTWLRFWPWLTDEEAINDNIFLKAAVGLAHYEAEIDGVRYPPPPEGVALAARERAAGYPISDNCDLAAIGARDVPPGTPWRE